MAKSNGTLPAALAAEAVAKKGPADAPATAQASTIRLLLVKSSPSAS
jgi:hypothetical protein